MLVEKSALSRAMGKAHFHYILHFVLRERTHSVVGSGLFSTTVNVLKFQILYSILFVT